MTAPSTYPKAKRDTHSTCPTCGEVFRQDGIGRMRVYCSDACKMRAARRKHAGKPGRKEVCEIRTDYLEQQIGYYDARGQYAAVDALWGIVREVGAPVDKRRVEFWRKTYAEALAAESWLSFRNEPRAETLRNSLQDAQAGELTP